jgi:hypothetical protein
MSKLLVFISLAVAICVKVGYYFDKKRNRVKLKNHGYRAKSVFREGLDIVRETLKREVTRWNDLWARHFSFFVDDLDKILSTIVIAKNLSGRALKIKVAALVLVLILRFLLIFMVKFHQYVLHSLKRYQQINRANIYFFLDSIVKEAYFCALNSNEGELFEG